MHRSTSAKLEALLVEWPALPTETEIYILPDGRVVIADMPAELAPLAAQLGIVDACALANRDTPKASCV